MDDKKAFVNTLKLKCLTSEGAKYIVQETFQEWAGSVVFRLRKIMQMGDQVIMTAHAGLQIIFTDSETRLELGLLLRDRHLPLALDL